MSNSKRSSHPAQRRYPPELRERATRMVFETIAETGERHGVIGRIARQLGVGTETLRNWVRQARSTAGRGRVCRARSAVGWRSSRRRSGSCGGPTRS